MQKVPNALQNIPNQLHSPSLKAGHPLPNPIKNNSIKVIGLVSAGSLEANLPLNGKDYVETKEILKKFQILESTLKKYQWKSPKVFTFDASGWRWGNDAADALVKSVCRIFSELKEFHLNVLFRDYYWSEDNQFERMMQILPMKSATLQTVDLYFYTQNGTDDRGLLTQIAKAISNPQNKIKSFCLSLSRFNSVENDGLRQLFLAIGKYLVDLEELSFKCYFADDVTIEALYQEIAGKNKKLRKKEIYLDDCHMLNKEEPDDWEDLE